MWPVFVVQFKSAFLSFDAGGEEDFPLFFHPFAAQFWCSWMGLKGLIYSFQEQLLVCKCGQYWSCNLISSFWSLGQGVMRREPHYSCTHFLLNFGVLWCIWKLSFIAFRTISLLVNLASIGPPISFQTFDPSCSFFPEHVSQPPHHLHIWNLLIFLKIFMYNMWH